MRKLYYFVIIIALLIFSNMTIVANAIGTGFSTHELTDENQNIIKDNINLSLIKQEPSRRPIECFDVNSNGELVIGQSNFRNKTICVYSDDMVFQYGYTFTSNGDFGVEWDGENVIIYFVRSDIALNVNSKGKIEDIFKIENTTLNNLYWNKAVFATSRKVNNIEYELKNDMGFFNIFVSSYSLLTMTDGNEENILYNAYSVQHTNMIVTAVGSVAFVSIAIFFIVHQLQRQGDGSPVSFQKHK